MATYEAYDDKIINKVGEVDFGPINARIDKVVADVADEFDDTSAYSIGDIVVYEDDLYQFTSAHTANTDWNSSEVSQINIIDYIASLNVVSSTDIHDIQVVTALPADAASHPTTFYVIKNT